MQSKPTCGCWVKSAHSKKDYFRLNENKEVDILKPMWFGHVGFKFCPYCGAKAEVSDE